MVKNEEMEMIRKSLVILLALTIASPVVAAGVQLKSTLRGGGSVDPDGSGTFSATVDRAKGQLCYKLKVKNIDVAQAAHIHKGAAGASGPPVVPLGAPVKGSSKGCASVAADALSAIVAHPADYYVNVHNAAFPGGAIRGQLTK
jgi:hypothetical protein